MKRSPHFRDGKFHNIHPTEVMRPGASIWGMLKDYATKPKDVAPSQTLPVVKTNLRNLTDSSPTIVWFGHSSYLIKYLGRSILVDPVLSGHASPFSFIVKAFKGADAYKPQDMPAIDMLVITHDHYDHLDYETILQLKDRIKHIYTPLGVGAHLEHWGIPAQDISEFDWWESENVSSDIDITAAPARHFSGRGPRRFVTLWASFVLRLGNYRFFIGGDSGHDQEFKEIGTRLGPIDLAFMECGQYGRDWPFIHSFPEQTAKAAKDLGAKHVMPVHWGKFILSTHSWCEPVERFLKASSSMGFNVITPKIGEPIVMDSFLPQERWWR